MIVSVTITVTNCGINSATSWCDQPGICEIGQCVECPFGNCDHSNSNVQRTHANLDGMAFERIPVIVRTRGDHEWQGDGYNFAELIFRRPVDERRTCMNEVVNHPVEGDAI